MKRTISWLAMLSTVAGCTSLPAMPEDDPTSIALLADIIECEILTTFSTTTNTGKFDFSNWAASYQITQNATETGGGALLPVTWLAPVGVDKLVYSASAGIERETYRNGKAEYSVTVVNPTSTACARTENLTNVTVTPRDFRLRDWVSQISASDPERLNNFSYSVRVQMTTNAGAGPVFENGKWTATGALYGKRITVKTVDFAFLPKPGKPKPTEVIVVAPIPQAGVTPKANTHRKRVLKSTAPASTVVPESVIIENRGIIQGQQLDRVTPNGILDR